MVETYILSQLNYGDIILQNLTLHLEKKVQTLQNRCVRFIYGLRKYDHISAFTKNKNILNMKNRRLLHGLSLMFKIVNKKAPAYLCNRIKSHTEIHHHNTRNRKNIDPPFARTKTRNMSYFIFIAKKFNELSKKVDINDCSLSTFKRKCKTYLLDLQ